MEVFKIFHSFNQRFNTIIVKFWAKFCEENFAYVALSMNRTKEDGGIECYLCVRWKILIRIFRLIFYKENKATVSQPVMNEKPLRSFFTMSE